MAKVHDLMEEYITLRDRRDARKRRYKEEDLEDEKRQDKIEALLMKLFDHLGTDTVSVKGIGTAYKAIRTSASVADKEAFMEFVRKQDEWPLLEVRASKLAVEQYKDVHGDIPPGINWGQEYVVNIRRSS